jgi:hypothetical protein
MAESFFGYSGLEFALKLPMNPFGNRLFEQRNVALSFQIGLSPEFKRIDVRMPQPQT